MKRLASPILIAIFSCVCTLFSSGAAFAQATFHSLSNPVLGVEYQIASVSFSARPSFVGVPVLSDGEVAYGYRYGGYSSRVDAYLSGTVEEPSGALSDLGTNGFRAATGTATATASAQADASGTGLLYSDSGPATVTTAIFYTFHNYGTYNFFLSERYDGYLEYFIYVPFGPALPGETYRYGDNGFFGGSDFSMNAPYSITIAPVPEPETYAMLLAGLGLIGFVGARRRRNTHG